jgi:flagellar motor switch/type III secretory pathway protein FliN
MPREIVSATLNSEVVERLRAIAERTNIPVSRLIEEAIKSKFFEENPYVKLINMVDSTLSLLKEKIAIWEEKLKELPDGDPRKQWIIEPFNNTMKDIQKNLEEQRKSLMEKLMKDLAKYPDLLEYMAGTVAGTEEIRKAVPPPPEVQIEELKKEMEERINRLERQIQELIRLKYGNVIVVEGQKGGEKKNDKQR